MPARLLFDLQGKHVFVAGHKGLAGSALLRRLGREDCEILTVDRRVVDLTRPDQIEPWLLQMNRMTCFSRQAASQPTPNFLRARPPGRVTGPDGKQPRARLRAHPRSFDS